jgi:hypothetical protein
LRLRIAFIAALLALGCTTTTGTLPRAASPSPSASKGTDTLHALRVPDPGHLLPPLADSADYGSILGPLRISELAFNANGKGLGMSLVRVETNERFPQNLATFDDPPTRVLDLRGGSVRQVGLLDLAVGQEVVAWSTVCVEDRRGPCFLVAIAIIGGPSATPTPPVPTPATSPTPSPSPSPSASASPDAAASGTVSPPR